MIEENLINKDLIRWLQKIINLKISNDLILNIDIKKSNWIINKNFSDKFIKIPIIKDLYITGSSKNLICGSCDALSQGFSLYNKNIKMPGKISNFKIVNKKKDLQKLIMIF